MTQSHDQNFDAKKLLTAYTNMLHSAFIESKRNDAKRLFKQLATGKVVPMLRINFENGNYLDTQLQLDHSIFRGHLNYSAFSQAITALLVQIVSHLKSDEDLHTLRSENHDELLFKIAGFVKNGDEVNVLMLSLQQVAVGIMRAQLMFMDPDQFKKNESDVVE